MFLKPTLLLFLVTASSAFQNTTAGETAASNFAGYLISTFSDANPTVQLHLSRGNDPSSFIFANRGRPVMTSTVGTRAVRDVYLTCNNDRSQWYMIGTGKQTIELRRENNKEVYGADMKIQISTLTRLDSHGIKLHVTVVEESSYGGLPIFWSGRLQDSKSLSWPLHYARTSSP
jgi:hypothetical protein